QASAGSSWKRCSSRTWATRRNSSTTCFTRATWDASLRRRAPDARRACLGISLVARTWPTLSRTRRRRPRRARVALSSGRSRGKRRRS
ncbi:hypothetical protein BN1723_017340, partial [Verticillium longisporum]